MEAPATKRRYYSFPSGFHFLDEDLIPGKKREKETLSWVSTCFLSMLFNIFFYRLMEVGKGVAEDWFHFDGIDFGIVQKKKVGDFSSFLWLIPVWYASHLFFFYFTSQFVFFDGSDVSRIEKGEVSFRREETLVYQTRSFSEAKINQTELYSKRRYIAAREWEGGIESIDSFCAEMDKKSFTSHLTLLNKSRLSILEKRMDKG